MTIQAGPLRHRPTALFCSVPTGLPLVALVVVVVGLLSGASWPVTGGERVGLAVAWVPLTLVWRTRVRLEPGSVTLVNGVVSHHVDVGEIRDVQLRRWWYSAWLTRVVLRDGTTRRVWGLTAIHLGAGPAGRRPPASLLEPVDVLRRHAGLAH